MEVDLDMAGLGREVVGEGIEMVAAAAAAAAGSAEEAAVHAVDAGDSEDAVRREVGQGVVVHRMQGVVGHVADSCSNVVEAVVDSCCGLKGMVDCDVMMMVDDRVVYFAEVDTPWNHTAAAVVVADCMSHAAALPEMCCLATHSHKHAPVGAEEAVVVEPDGLLA